VLQGSGGRRAEGAESLPQSRMEAMSGTVTGLRKTKRKEGESVGLSIHLSNTHQSFAQCGPMLGTGDFKMDLPWHLLLGGKVTTAPESHSLSSRLQERRGLKSW
jgi:hypothetical protein